MGPRADRGRHRPAARAWWLITAGCHRPTIRRPSMRTCPLRSSRPSSSASGSGWPSGWSIASWSRRSRSCLWCRCLRPHAAGRGGVTARDRHRRRSGDVVASTVIGEAMVRRGYGQDTAVRQFAMMLAVNVGIVLVGRVLVATLSDRRIEGAPCSCCSSPLIVTLCDLPADHALAVHRATDGRTRRSRRRIGHRAGDGRAARGRRRDRRVPRPRRSGCRGGCGGYPRRRRPGHRAHGRRDRRGGSRGGDGGRGRQAGRSGSWSQRRRAGRRPFVDVSFEDWRRVLDVHVDGAFHVTRAVLPGMTAAARGRIVNIASEGGLAGRPERPVRHRESRPGRLHPVARLSARPARDGSTRSPRDPSTRRCCATTTPPQSTPSWPLRIGRFLEPDEIAATIAFMASPGGDAYVGQVLSPNGGTAFPG